MDYMTPLTAFRDAISTTDRPATLNRQTLNPPGVLITLRGFDDWTLGGNAEAALNLYVVTGDRNEENALLELSPHLAGVLESLDGLNMPVEAIETDLVATSDASPALPAFKISTHLSI